jgi:cytochrome c2
MTFTWRFYTALVSLFVVLSLWIGFNLAAWGLHRFPTPPVWHVPGGDAKRGRVLVREYGCGACHVVPGVRGAVGQVGPRLDRVRSLIYVAGVQPNTPENLTLWIMNPKAVDPLTAMPNLDVRKEDAQDIAAYLYEAR